MQYVIVTFTETRGVLIDGRFAGYTNSKLRVNWGMHIFQLDGQPDYTPGSQAFSVMGTTLLSPLMITFENN